MFFTTFSVRSIEMLRYQYAGVLCLCPLAAFLFFLLGFITPSWGEGSCRVEETSEFSSPMMVRKLVGQCSQAEREALAVSAQDVLQALQEGQGVDLEGVILKGDLPFDALPLVPVPDTLPLSSTFLDRLKREQVTSIRMIHGPLRFVHVDFQGIVATNLVDEGYILIKGPVVVTNSTVRRSIDFSRALFLEEVDFSGTTIGHEGFFIKAVFGKNASFRHTAFGKHSRFHKAVFDEQAIFTDSAFHGLAEFLEVEFHKDADFSGTQFGQGTGFSGSQFRGDLDFSNVTFDGEIYFRFAKFGKDNTFRGAAFQKTADFTEATFEGDPDFTAVKFGEHPTFTEERVAAQFDTEKNVEVPTHQLSLVLIGGLFLLLCYCLFRKTAVHRSN